MKYYLPTTTLNFSNILSSECISPARRYKERVLGFNHLELSTLNCSPDYLFVCDRIQNYSIEANNDDDYPLVVELNESTIPELKLVHVPDDSVRIWAVSSTIYISPKTARFMFRSEGERRRMLLRVGGTLENKCDQLYRGQDCFVVATQNENRRGGCDLTSLLKEWSACNKVSHDDGIATDVENERRCGAELGASIGTWLIDVLRPTGSVTQRKETWLRNALAAVGIQENAFDELLGHLKVPKNRLFELISDVIQTAYTPHSRSSKLMFTASGSEWRARAYELLADVLEFIVRRGNIAWRWDRQSLVMSCKSIWEDVLFPRLRTAPQSESYRDSFNRLLMNLQTQTTPYSIRDERSPFLQAFAAFVIGGRDSDKLARIIAAENVRCPEIAMSLYGAIIGYSQFPRTLMDVERYQCLPPPPPPPSPPPTAAPRTWESTLREFCSALTSMKKVSKKNKQVFMTEIVPAVLSGSATLNDIETWGNSATVPKSAMKALIGSLTLEMKRGGSNETDSPKPINKRNRSPQMESNPPGTVQGFLPFAPRAVGGMPIKKIGKLFVDDVACIESIIHCEGGDLDVIPVVLRTAIANALGIFQKKYQSGEHYGDHPDKYQRHNGDTIDHFSQCLYSKSTTYMNVTLTVEQRTALEVWLRKRYGC